MLITIFLKLPCDKIVGDCAQIVRILFMLIVANYTA